MYACAGTNLRGSLLLACAVLPSSSWSSESLLALECFLYEVCRKTLIFPRVFLCVDTCTARVLKLLFLATHYYYYDYTLTLARVAT